MGSAPRKRLMTLVATKTITRILGFSHSVIACIAWPNGQLGNACLVEVHVGIQGTHVIEEVSSVLGSLAGYGGGNVNRETGVGLIGSGIALIVVGAILEFAVTVTTRGFNVHTVGMILLLAGIVAFIAGLLLVVSGRTRRSMQREELRTTPTGQERVVEERDNLSL